MVSDKSLVQPATGGDWVLYIRDPVSHVRNNNIADNFYRLDELRRLAAAMSAWLKKASQEAVQASMVSISGCSIMCHSVNGVILTTVVAGMSSEFETR